MDNFEFGEIYGTVNPFVEGQVVKIPKGMEFISMHPNDDGVQVTKKEISAVVEHSQNFWVDPTYTGSQEPRFSQEYRGTNISTVVHDPMIVIAGNGGYWKRFPVTEELLEANGIPRERELAGYVHVTSGRFRSINAMASK